MPDWLNALMPGNRGPAQQAMGNLPVMMPGGGTTGAPLQGAGGLQPGQHPMLPPTQIGMVPGVPGSMGLNPGGAPAPVGAPMPGGGAGVPPQPGAPQPGDHGGHPDSSQWRNLPGYGMLQMLQHMQTTNPDVFNRLMQSGWAQRFGITPDNLGTMESRQQAKADALGRTWNPPQMFGGLPAPTAPAPAATPASIQAPVAPQAPGASSYQLPTY